MLLSTLASFAFAGENAVAYATNPEVSVLVECAPLRGMLRADSAAELDELMASMGTDKDMDWIRLLDPAQAAAAGFDLDGGMLMVASKLGDNTGVLASIAFSGTDAQADALLRSFSDKFERTSTGWQINADNDPMLLTLQGGQLQLTGQAAPPQPGSGDVPQVLNGLSDADSCVIFIRSKGDGKVPAGEFALQTLFGDGKNSDVRMRADIPEHPAPKLLARSKAPLGGSSEEAPMAVLTIGVPLLDLVDLLPDKPATAGAKAEIAKMKFKIKAGTTLAFSGSKEDPNLSAAMRVGGRMGMPHSGARVSRAVEKALTDNGAPVERVDKRTLMISLNGGPVSGKTLWIGTRFGKMYVATDEAGLNTLIDGGGTPWLTPEQAQFASEWAVAMSFNAEDVASGQFGFGSDGDIWVVQLSAVASGDVNAGEKLLAGPLARASQTLGARLDDTFSQVESSLQSDFPAEPDGNVKGLCIAELSFDAAFDQFVPVPVHPRPVEAVNADGVPWQPQPEEWKTLGWTPDSDTLQGAYWVEVYPESGTFVVHGVTDLDGDGVQAHVRADSAQSCALEQIGPPGAR